MRILVAGDTHGNLGHCMYLVRRAQEHNCDRIFIVGDFGYWAHTRDGREFLDELSTYAEDQNVWVYFCDGNHDKTSLLLQQHGDDADEEGFLRVRSFLRYAPRGHRWTWNGVRFIALGGAYSIDKKWRTDNEKYRPYKYKPESLWFPEEEMTDEDMAKILADTSPVDVILAHDKPRGSDPGWDRGSPIACLPNQDRLQRAVQVLDPKLYIHGHLHWPYEFDLRHSSGQLSKMCPECGGQGSYYTEWSDSAEKAMKNRTLEVVVLHYPDPPDGTVDIQCPKCNGAADHNHDDMHITKVIGLDCDGNAGGDKHKSWWIFDTEEMKKEWDR